MTRKFKGDRLQGPASHLTKVLSFGSFRLSRATAGLSAILALVLPMGAQAQQFVQVNPLSFTMPVGGPNSQPQNVRVTSTGGSISYGTMVETVTGGNWLQVNFSGCNTFNTCFTPPNNFCPDSMLTVSVTASTLPAGVYTGEILLTSGTATMTVSVTLSVVAQGGAPFFGPFVSQLGFVFGGGINPVPLPQTIQITNAGIGTLNWTLAVSTFGGGNWLSVSAQSGVAPSIITVNVSDQGLQPGIYTGQLLFQSGSGNVTVPVTFEVVSGTTPEFDQMPALSFTMPRVVWSFERRRA